MTTPIRSQEPDCRHTNVHDTDAHTETSKTTHSHGASSVQNQSNSVCSDNNVTQSTSQAQQSEPTDCAREATTQCCIDPGYAMDQMLKLQNDPDYKDTLDQLAKAEQLERGQGLYLIDAEFGGFLGFGKNDGKIDRGNIEAAAKDPCAPGHEAAKMLMANPRLFAAIDADGDGLITKDELHKFIDKMKNQKKWIEDSYALKAKTPTFGIGDDPQPMPPPVAQKPPPPPGQGSKPQPPPVRHAPPPPPPSTPVLSSRGGLEGASENINNALSSCEDQMAQLSAQMAATDDPKEQAAIQNKMNALERRMQMLSSMYQEIMTVLSNLSKMQSDIAMTFIRNMK